MEKVKSVLNSIHKSLQPNHNCQMMIKLCLSIIVLQRKAALKKVVRWDWFCNSCALSRFVLLILTFLSLPISVPKYLHQAVVQTSEALQLVPTLNFKAFLSFCFLVVRFSRYSKLVKCFIQNKNYVFWGFPLDLDPMKYIYWKWRGQKYVLGARLLSSAQRWGGIYLSMSSAHVTCTSCRMYVHCSGAPQYDW